jgi:hypothetical protein
MEDMEGPRGTGRQASISVTTSMALVILTLVAFAGILVGRATSVSFVSAADEPDATATRQAEIDELNQLRTQVAQTVVCVPPTPTPTPVPTETPVPTATPTPVPPVAMGTALPYADDWTVNVTGLLPAPASEAIPSGRFVQVTATITNNGEGRRTFSFGEWRLVDPSGRVFMMADSVTTQLYGASWYLGIDPSLETEFRIVFDVASDAGSAFILESSADPTFRVAVQLQQLG